jgi:hypothetical protein
MREKIATSPTKDTTRVSREYRKVGVYNGILQFGHYILGATVGLAGVPEDVGVSRIVK